MSLLGGAASYGIFFWLASSKGNLTALSSLTFLTPVRLAVAYAVRLQGCSSMDAHACFCVFVCTPFRV